MTHDRQGRTSVGERVTDASLRQPPPDGGRSAEATDPRSAPSKPGPIFLRGELIARGWAPRRVSAHAKPSYFVTIRMSAGEHTIWNRELEPAFKNSQTQPQLGDAIGLSGLTRQDQLWDAERILREGGPPPAGSRPQLWIVEKQEFFELRRSMAAAFRDPRRAPQMVVQGYPELEKAYSLLAWIALATHRSMAPREAKQHIVRTFREGIASRIERGYPIPQVPDHFYPAHLKVHPGRADALVRG